MFKHNCLFLKIIAFKFKECVPTQSALNATLSQLHLLHPTGNYIIGEITVNHCHSVCKQWLPLAAIEVAMFICVRVMVCGRFFLMHFYKECKCISVKFVSLCSDPTEL